jgi:hypothetical protein
MQKIKAVFDTTQTPKMLLRIDEIAQLKEKLADKELQQFEVHFQDQMDENGAYPLEEQIKDLRNFMEEKKEQQQQQQQEVKKEEDSEVPDNWDSSDE